MADAKRHPSGPVAMPARGPPPSGAGVKIQSSELVSSLGARVQITTVLNHILEGTLYAADPILNLIAVDIARRTSNATPNTTADIHIVATNQISNFVLLSASQGDSFKTAYPPLGSSPSDISKKRLEDEVRKLQEQEARKGKGVGKEAQDIFDALYRAISNTRWADTSIVVNDNVRIDRPYRPEDCKAASKDLSALNHVKRVLEGERKKLGLTSAPRPAAVPTPVALPAQRAPERKGG